MRRCGGRRLRVGWRRQRQRAASGGQAGGLPGGRVVAAMPSGGALRAQTRGSVPDVGERAPRVHTPTVADVGGDQSKVDTRSPAGTMHDVDLYDVLGRKPVILVFATPALCQSR